jgi:hypothetical protein
MAGTPWAHKEPPRGCPPAWRGFAFWAQISGPWIRSKPCEHRTIHLLALSRCVWLVSRRCDQRAVAGVAVRGVIELIDVRGGIVHLKSAGPQPSGAAPTAAGGQVPADRTSCLRVGRDSHPGGNQVTQDRVAGLSGEARRCAALRAVYRVIRETARSDVYLPNCGSNLCIRKYYNVAKTCEAHWDTEVVNDHDCHFVSICRLAISNARTLMPNPTPNQIWSRCCSSVRLLRP